MKKTKTYVTVATTVNMPTKKAWALWTSPEHITNWNFASDDWQCPTAENDLRKGGKFVSRMEAKDGSAGFDFAGCYDEVILHKLITYTMDDGRKVRVTFDENEGKTKITEIFEAEESHTVDQQKTGWQLIMDNFKIYAESIN